MSEHLTYFFRDPAQLDVLAGPVLDDLLAHSPRVRLWSAGCSSGEEPYTLAMRLLETGKIAGERLSIRATDIAPDVLAAAREGIYGGFAFRVTDAARIARWFRPCGGGFAIGEEVKRLVSFGELDLRDGARAAAAGPFDAIFCRYVLLYADEPARLLESLAGALRPGGYLFLDDGEYPDVAGRFAPVPGSSASVYRLAAAVCA